MTAAAVGAAVIGISVSSASSDNSTPGSSVAATAAVASGAQTTTPIKHVVVLFDENISFDHYFGTYPYAQNQPGEPQFHALPNTPTVNGLQQRAADRQPEPEQPAAARPRPGADLRPEPRLHARAVGVRHGLMDQFVQNTTGSGCTRPNEP